MKYGDKVAVDGLSLIVPTATITSVLGPNGAGKTTTLETCEGYRRAQRGRVEVLGLDPYRQHRELAPRIGVMLQGGGAWSGARAWEMLRHIAALHADPLDPGMLYERLGLAVGGRTPYRRLSGGQQQRLGLAMALVGRPDVVFVDEPTAGMDPQARRTTWELLEELRHDGVTVVLTTHHMDEAERLSDLIHIIDRGKVIASGPPSELTSSHASTIRLTLPRPLDQSGRDQLVQALPRTSEVKVLEDGTVVVSGPTDHRVLGAVGGWCEAQRLVPLSLTMGQGTLEDVFIELTGREMAR